MKISIITLNYNGSEKTAELIKSLNEQTDHDFNIILVDNASEEADFDKIKSTLVRIPTPHDGYPQIQIIRNRENFGFSGGNNIGIRQALKNSSDWIVLLNNDTWVEKGFIERLKAILSVKTGIIGIPLIEDGPSASLRAGPSTSVRASRIAYCGKIQWLKPTLIHIPTSQVAYPQIYAIGGAVAIHKDVFDKIGLLDEKYFLYFEDADFSIRAGKAGFNISIAENLTANHHVSSSTKKLGSPLLLRYHYRNAIYFNFKNGPWYIKFLVWPWSWLVLIKQLAKIAINKNKEESKAILSGVLDFYKRKYGKI